MREFIGECQSCGEYVYCEDGFFDGVHKDGQLLCHGCADETESDDGNPL